MRGCWRVASVMAGAVLFVVPDDARILPALPLVLERVLQAVALAWFVNVYNFMDGIDLMTVAQTLPIAGALMALGVVGAVEPLPTLVARSTGGAAVAVLLWDLRRVRR